MPTLGSTTREKSTKHDASRVARHVVWTGDEPGLPRQSTSETVHSCLNNRMGEEKLLFCSMSIHSAYMPCNQNVSGKMQVEISVQNIYCKILILKCIAFQRSESFLVCCHTRNLTFWDRLHKVGVSFFFLSPPQICS